MASKIIEEWRAVVGDDIIGVPRMRGTAEGMKQDGVVGVSTSYISSAAATIWHVVSEDLACDAFKVDDIIKVELDGGDASEGRFYDCTLLAEFPDDREGHRLFALHGQVIGRLESRKGWRAEVPILEFRPLKGEVGAVATIGMVFPAERRSYAGEEGMAKIIAQEDAELRRVRIIGRVTGWLAGPSTFRE